MQYANTTYMTAHVPDFASTAPAAQLTAPPASLAVALPTALVLVDYALRGLATPTMDPQRVAAELPVELVRSSNALRAVLAHGTVLRDTLAHELAPGHAGHRDWGALREWLAGWSDDRLLAMVEYGIDAGLAFPSPTDEAPRSDDARHAIRRPLGQRDIELLTSWQVPDAAGQVADLLQPDNIRTTLLQLLDAIWASWLQHAWNTLPADPTPNNAQQAMSAAQWITQVTGRRPDETYTRIADRAEHLVVMPCPGLGHSLSLFELPDRTTVLFTPSARSAADHGSKRGGASPSVTVPGRLTSVLRALGDPTRLAIVLQLLDDGPMTMSRLIEAVGVHQTTISRQVSALRSAGLVHQDQDRRIVVNGEEIRTVCQTLIKATS